MQWVYAIFGLLAIGWGAYVLWLLIEDRDNSLHWFGTLLLLAAFIGAGVWVSWPIFVACRDLVSGTSHAVEIIRSRDSMVHRQFLRLKPPLGNWNEVTALALTALVPLLWRAMARREPDSRSHWVVLFVGLATGYLVLAHCNVHIWPWSVGGELIELPLHRILVRHEGPLGLRLARISH